MTEPTESERVREEALERLAAGLGLPRSIIDGKPPRGVRRLLARCRARLAEPLRMDDDDLEWQASQRNRAHVAIDRFADRLHRWADAPMRAAEHARRVAADPFEIDWSGFAVTRGGLFDFFGMPVPYLPRGGNREGELVASGGLGFSIGLPFEPWKPWARWWCNRPLWTRLEWTLPVLTAPRGGISYELPDTFNFQRLPDNPPDLTEGS